MIERRMEIRRQVDIVLTYKIDTQSRDLHGWMSNYVARNIKLDKPRRILFDRRHSGVWARKQTLLAIY